MSTAFAGAVGYAPSVRVGPPVRPSEQEIYRKMWSKPEYRVVAPGEFCAQTFLEQAQPKPGATVIDFGCGTGRGALALAIMGGLNVTMLDFADNCLDADILPMLETQAHVLRFQTHDLTQPVPVQAQYGFCTDVLEHIPTADIDRVLDHILGAAQHCFFQISTEDDVMGGLIGHPLHLTVQPFAWWLAKFNARDCVIHWSKDEGATCLFYVSAWVDAKEVVDAGVANTELEQIRANVTFNTAPAQGWEQVQPHPTNDVDVMIVGGGPSLATHLDEIKELRADGVKLITLNGAYNWALENGLTPSAQVMVDARSFNARFVDPVVPECKYFIASQCDPSVLANLPKDRTLLWHTSAADIQDILKEHYELWWGVPGGSTVLLRAIPLFRMLGFRRFHLFGCDSCCVVSQHHAYAQPENDSQWVIPVTCGDRIFHCHPWMVSQAQEFIDLIKFLGTEIELEIHGDGLLQYILRTGAELSDEV